MFEPIRGGTRGGQAEFKWSDVSADKDRENYLGHSINAPTGRWQKNKDVHWYNRDKKLTETERDQEIRKIKELEAEALSVALGFEPSKKATGANAGPVNNSAIQSTSPTAPNPENERLRLEKEEGKRSKEERREERRARKEARKAEKYSINDVERRGRDAERRRRSRSPWGRPPFSLRRSRSRSRSPRRVAHNLGMRTYANRRSRSRSRTPRHSEASPGQNFSGRDRMRLYDEEVRWKR